MSNPLQRRHFLLLALLLPLMAGPPAHAATQACKEGIKATIEGKIAEIADAGDRMSLNVEDPSWDCGVFYVALTKAQAQSCALGGTMRATGTLTRKDQENMAGFWTLTDRGPGNKGPRLTRSFSCSAARAGSAKPESGKQK